MEPMAVARAMPKSMILTELSSMTKMLLGLMSRCDEAHIRGRRAGRGRLGDRFRSGVSRVKRGLGVAN